MNGNLYYIGVDVGTSSARAALVGKDGTIITSATHPIMIWEPQEDYYEQSSDNIWQAVCKVVQSVASSVDKTCIRGIGFDATCSLVVLDADFKPVSVSPSGERDVNIIMWMDHRAATQAHTINATQHEVLRYVGGKMSLEMQMPKLLWLKQNMRESCWDKAGHLFDLPDFLTWKATGSRSRSLCSLVCKWGYLADADGGKGWSDEFLKQINLEELASNNYAKIGGQVLSPGEPCGEGLSTEAASQLGLLAGTPIGTSIVDAHAGGLGTLGCEGRPASGDSRDVLPPAQRLALICGTSTCHMAVSETPLFVPGVWGPYYSAMVPGLWLNEGGQSSTGKLIDHIVENHVSYSWIKSEAEEKGKHVHEVLNEVLEYTVRKQLGEGGAKGQKTRTVNNGGGSDGQGGGAKTAVDQSVTELTRHLHVWPDYHGNRSPVAEPSLKGMVSGLSLSHGVEDLALQYLATIQALAYGTRHIIDSLKAEGHDIQEVCICGGLSKNRVFVQTHSDVTGLDVIIPDAVDAVLLGSATLGAYASGQFNTIQDAMRQMGGKGTVVTPNQSVHRYHSKKYAVFLKMLEHQKQYKEIMSCNS